MGSQAAEISSKIWACGFAYSIHCAVLSHKQGGHYNSFIYYESRGCLLIDIRWTTPYYA